MKFGFYIMGKKGWISIQHAIEKVGSDAIAYVVSAKDLAVENDYFSEIKELIHAHHIPFFERTKAVELPHVDYSVAISWRWLIHSDIDKLIVFHDSLLPKNRGFNPLVTCLIEGERQIGVTAIKANKSFDSGNILGQRAVAINYPIKIQEAIDAVSLLYKELLADVMQSVLQNSAVETPQDDAEATYSLWRDEEDYRIDWNCSASDIQRFIDAVGFPYLGAATHWGDLYLRVLDAEVVDDLKITNRTAGKVIFLEEGLPVVVCGKGLLKLKRVVESETGNLITFDKLRIRFK